MTLKGTVLLFLYDPNSTAICMHIDAIGRIRRCVWLGKVRLISIQGLTHKSSFNFLPKQYGQCNLASTIVY